MATPQLPIVSADPKDRFEEIDHLEKKDAVLPEGLAAYSRFAHLDRITTAKTFWVSILWACAAGVGALFDGFLIVSELGPPICLVQFN